MFLIQTKIEEAVYKLKPLAYQAVITDTGYDLEDISVTGPISECAKSPVESIFIAIDHDQPEPDTFNVRAGDLIPLFYNESVFPLTSIDEDKLQEICQYTIVYMLENPSVYKQDYIQKIADQFATYGYTYDWEELTTVKEVDLSDASSLKRSILMKYPAPSLEDCGFHIEPDVWFLLIRNILRGENSLITGPSGIA